MDINSMIINWNNATIKSLKEQIKLNENIANNSYKNRLEYFPESVKNPTSPRSTRYQFLTKFKEEKNREENFYIVEATREGEQVQFRYFVMYFRDNITSLYIYNFKQGKWVGERLVNKFDLNLSNKLSTYRSKNGFNDDDIIITKFVRNAVDDSEFFVGGTLSSNTNLKKLLYPLMK